MKKYLFFATALVALASCSSNDYIGEQPPVSSQSESGAIKFGTGLSAVTRADHVGADAANLLKSNFVVEGVKSDGTTQVEVFDHYNVKYLDGTDNTTTSNTDGWEYVAQPKHAYGPSGDQSIKYWDYAMSQYDFIAYSIGEATAVYTSGEYVSGTNVYITEIDASKMNGRDTSEPNDGKIDEGAYSIKGKASELAKVYIADLKTAYRDASPSDYQNTVQFKFRSLSAKVRLALYETVPGYSVKDVVFYTDASTAAADSKAHLYTTGTDVFNEEGTYIVYYPTTGYANKNNTDYNKAHLLFNAVSGGTSTVKDFGSLDAANKYVAREDRETASTTDKLYIGRSSNEATYAGEAAKSYYTIVIPNETGAVLNLKVDYTLVSTDGSGEPIKVTGATAKVPKEYAAWKSGYAYTYLFKISQNSNGQTGPDSPVGLYPITFDAVVVNDEVDGTQETITTVSEPSITTYAKGTVVTANNEYPTGSNIYVVVNQNGENVTLSTTGTVNAKLYTVTLVDTDDTDAITTPAQTINEASVANALANGGQVIDINKFKMNVVAVGGLTAVTQIAATDSPDGNAINVKAAKFTPASVGTYVFEYIDTSASKKYYKIIKVVAAP